VELGLRRPPSRQSLDRAVEGDPGGLAVNHG
jgi:hypothetical protein